MTRYDAKRHDDQVRLLSNAGYEAGQIARILKDFDAKTIRRQLVRMGLVDVRPYSKPTPTPPDHGPDPRNPVEHARLILGKRVTERGGAYWLDGRLPVSAKQLVQEANRVRVRNGEPEFGPPGWRA